LEQIHIARPLHAVESRPQPQPVAPSTWVPLVEVFEEADTVRVIAELPGVRPKDVSVSLEGNRLTIAGAKIRIEEEPAVKVQRFERVYGEFKRTFRLASAVDFTKVTAAYDLGVLTITLPKAEGAKRRQIPVIS
jgi:HSP20 family protein